MESEDELKQKKMEELRQEYMKQREEESRQMDAERQVQLMLKKFVDDKALERLNNVKLVNRELYSKAFQAVMSLAQKGYLREKINEEQIKQLLIKLRPDREITIKRK